MPYVTKLFAREVSGTENVADMGTKYLDGPTHQRLLKKLPLKPEDIVKGAADIKSNLSVVVIYSRGFTAEQRCGCPGVRKRFRFFPPVFGSNLFCSLRHAFNGFFREMTTMSFAS